MIKFRSDLMRYVPMTELSGDTFYDYSNNGFHGTRYGPDRYGGRNGKPIFEFSSSSNEYISFPNTFNCDNNPKTFIFWANPTIWGTTFLSQDNSSGTVSQFYFRTESTNIINFTYASTNYYWENLFTVSTTNTILNRWNMYSAVFTGTAFLTYINGFLWKNNTAPVSVTYSMGTYGTSYGRNNTGNQYVNGYMHSFHCYNRALSKAEIISVMKDTMR